MENLAEILVMADLYDRSQPKQVGYDMPLLLL